MNWSGLAVRHKARTQKDLRSILLRPPLVVVCGQSCDFVPHNKSYNNVKSLMLESLTKCVYLHSLNHSLSEDLRHKYEALCSTLKRRKVMK